MTIEQHGLERFKEACINVFDFWDAVYKVAGLKRFLEVDMYPKYKGFEIGDWTIERFLIATSKDNKRGKNAFWLKDKMFTEGQLVKFKFEDEILEGEFVSQDGGIINLKVNGIITMVNKCFLI